MRLQAEHIQSFVELVRNGSIVGAAEARHLTQPAISNQMRQLQQDVGVKLYRRHGRGVILTSAGEAFHAHALAVVKALRAAEAFADGLAGGDAGLVRVASSQTIAGSLLPAFLSEFQRRHPHIEVHVDTSNSRQVLSRLGSYDIGLVETPLARDIPDDYRAVLLGRDEVVLVMPHDHALVEQDTVALQRLLDFPLIWREPGSGTNEVVEDACRQVGIMPSRKLSLGGVAAVLEAVRQGLGLGFVSQLSLRKKDDSLIARSLSPRLLRPLTMLLPEQPATVARVFADDFKESLASLLMP